MNITKRDAKKHLKVIRKYVLLADPEYLAAMGPIPDDEYSTYESIVYKLLLNNAAGEEIAKTLNDQSIANEILEWWKDITQNR